MIGKLRGRMDEIGDDYALLDVGGVGYHIFCSGRTLAALPAVGEAATLIIETHVREEHIHLYGFSDVVEREWFRLLTTVQRVGNKVALVIMSAYSPSQLANAIMAKDTAAFSRIKGIGAGLAERIVTELKDKAMKLPVESGAWSVKSGENKDTKKISGTRHTPPATHHEDTISALVNLGYSRSEAYTAALKASQSDVTELDQLIKLSLKELMRG
jgi:Holliday junction DNA helicase RuvA